MKTPAGGRGREVGKGTNRTQKIHHLQPPRKRQRDGLIGLYREFSPGRLVGEAAQQAEREGRLRADSGNPDPWFNDFAKWLRNGGRHEPVRWEATA